MTYKEEYLVEKIKINKINKTKNNYNLEHKKKFIRFRFECRIDSITEKSNKYYKVDLYITFYSEKKDVTHKYYLKCPKPMVEIEMLKILDANLLLIKSLGAYLDPIPLIEFILFKNWGRIDIINNKEKLLLDRNWHEFAPQHPSRELLEVLRSG